MGNSSETKSNGPEATKVKSLEDRLSEATSEKTLSDLEKTEKDASSTTKKWDSEPSPDGQMDDDRDGRADGSDIGGPM